MADLYAKGEKLDKMDVHEFRSFAQKHMVGISQDDFEDDSDSEDEEALDEEAAAQKR